MNGSGFTRCARGVRLACLFGLGLALLPVSARAMRTIGGKEPVRGSERWPDGTLAMVNLPTRFSHWEWSFIGFSAEVFQYRCSGTAEFNTALDTFSILVTPRHELDVYDGASTDHAIDDGRIDWTLTIRDADYSRLREEPSLIAIMADSPLFGKPVPPPVVALYLNPKNPIEWDKVTIPKNVTVVDKRVATSAYKSSKGGVVRVSVRDGATSAPLAGAMVVLGPNPTAPGAWTADYTAQTDRRGNVLIRDITPGIFDVRVSAPGHATWDFTYYENLGRTLETYDVTLAPEASLSATVVDQNGRPVAGATIRLGAVLGSNGQSYGVPKTNVLQSDARGRFTLDGLPAGSVNVYVTMDGYHQGSREMIKVPGKDVRITIGQGGIIRGKVQGMAQAAGQKVVVALDRADGPGVGIDSTYANCRDDGSYEFTDVAAGGYFIHAQAGSKSAPAKGAGLTKIELKAGEVQNVDLEIKIK